MSKSVPSHANHVMLVWCRRKAGLTIEDVALAEKIEVETLSGWETGNGGTPSLAMLRRLAERYKRPLQVFYLPSPQQEFSIVKDFRTIPQERHRDFTPQLLLAIRHCQERQSWASEYVKDEGGEPVEFLGKVNLKTPLGSVAKRIREMTGVTLDQQTAAKDARECLWLWRRAIEKLGVFVWQVSDVEVDEMRGFALADRHAPVIALNVADSYSARLFSLIHEFGHLLLGETAVSNSGGESRFVDPQFEIERFCNRLAAETLMPSADFAAHVPDSWKLNVDDVLRMLAARYGVSPAAALIRLVETDFTDQTYADQKLRELQKNGKKKGGPVKQPIKVVSKNGEAFSKLAFSAFEGGAIHGGQLTALLGMKLKHLDSFTRRIYPNRGLTLAEEG